MVSFERCQHDIMGRIFIHSSTGNLSQIQHGKDFSSFDFSHAIYSFRAGTLSYHHFRTPKSLITGQRSSRTMIIPLEMALRFVIEYINWPVNVEEV